MERVDYESIMLQDLLGYYDRAELDIAPWYQRRSVWSKSQKAYLVNTIHENKPVPSIYIRHTVDLETEKTIREVVDGQQRIRCVIEYRKNQFPTVHPAHNKPVRYSQLHPRERVHFLQSALSVGYLVDASDSNVIEIFGRINSIAKTINPQEKRNALFSGAYKQFCLSEAVKRLEFWRTNRIFTDTQISRMLEVQFTADLVMNYTEEVLLDFSAKLLDSYYKKYDDSFPHDSDVSKRLDLSFTRLLSLPEGLIRGTIFSTPQVLFSLMFVLDSTSKIRRQDFMDCIVDIDSRVEAVRTGEQPDAMPADVYGAFTSGNLHRIKSRNVRDAEIRRYLA